MVHELRLVGHQVVDSVRVTRGYGGIEARRVRGRGVRSHAALAPWRGSRGGGRGPRRRRFGDQLGEAGERLGLATDVEVLDARDETISSEGPECHDKPLVRAAAGAVGAEVRPAHEECVRSQRKDVVEPQRGVVGDLD